MSPLRRSTGSQSHLRSPLALTEELQLHSSPPPSLLAGECRPMTSYARMEGRASASTADDKTLQQRRKASLPQLNQTKASMSHSTRCSSLPRDVNCDDADPADVRNTASDVDTDEFKQAMWAGQANILVTVRLRPRLGHDRDNEEIVKVLDHKLVVVLDTATSNGNGASGDSSASYPSPVRRHTSHPLRKLRHASVSAAPARRSREKRFAFDYVFTPEDGQQTVYCHTTKFLIHGVLNGFNATVFAYGCTGAGKTYTMLGTPDAPGIMARTLEDLFLAIAKVHADPLAAVTYKVTVSFLEVYNENIRDLLVVATGNSNSSNGATTEFLDLREDPVRGEVVAGISEIEACNAQDVMKLLRRGNKHRSQEATAANAVSSRSHAVLQVLVEQREKASGRATTPIEFADAGSSDDAMATVVKFGKLSLVDLAGSERAAVTQNRGQRLLEGANINRSLLALGNCINALGEKSKSGASGAGAATFIPYRDSKLTRLLKRSLGGNCRTVMIANVSLAAASVEETLNTLKYANRAKNIKTTVARNVLRVDHHITEYVGVIATLRDEVASLKQQLARQQLLLPPESIGRSPRQASSAATLRPASNTNSSNNNNNSNNNNDNNDDDNSKAPSAEQIEARLRDVRAHIGTYFVERLRLRESLLRTDHQIEMLATSSASQIGSTATDHASTETASASETSKTETDATVTSPEIDAAPANHRNQDESSAVLAVAPRLLNNDDTLAVCMQQREFIARELVRLETRIEDFRAAILASATLLDHALFREVLMMEFRVGALEVERMELKLAHELRKHNDALAPTAWTRLPQLHQLAPYSPFAATTPPPSDRSNGADAGDRFERLGASQDDSVSSVAATQQRAPHPTTTSSYANATTSSSARRQWGLHLTSAALPYIRLKKKPSSNDDLPRLAASVGLSTGAASQSSITSLSSSTALAGAGASAGPYLRVLKHRRKSHLKATTAVASSHRKA